MKRIFFGLFVIIIYLIASGCSESSAPEEKPSDIVIIPPVQCNLSGKAEKGPLQKGSKIFIYELNKALNQAGVSFSTEIINELGEYKIPIEVESNFIELFGDGYYFDEITGGLSSARLILNALSKISGNDSASININILTTLSSPRIRYLIDAGLSFSDAKEYAEKDVLKAFGISNTSGTPFEQMTILEAGENNAKLLAVSVMLMQIAHWMDNASDVSATLSGLITTIKNDIETDGILDDDVVKTRINDAKKWTNLPLVRENLETMYHAVDPQITIPRFEDYFTPIAMTLSSTHLVGDYDDDAYGFFFTQSKMVMDSDGRHIYIPTGDGEVPDTLIVFDTKTTSVINRKSFDSEIENLALNASGTKILVLMNPWGPETSKASLKMISVLDTDTLSELDSVYADEIDYGPQHAVWSALPQGFSNDQDNDDSDLIDLNDKDGDLFYLIDYRKNRLRFLYLESNNTHWIQKYAEESYFDYFKELGDESILENREITDFSITHDHNTLFLTTESTEEWGEDAIINIWAELLFMPSRTVLEDNGADMILTSPDDSRIYLLYENYSVKNKTIIRVLERETDRYYPTTIGTIDLDLGNILSVNDMVLSPDGSILYVAHDYGITMVHTPTLSVVNPPNYQAVRRCQKFSGFHVSKMLIHPDGTKIYLLDYACMENNLFIINTNVSSD